MLRGSLSILLVVAAATVAHADELLDGFEGGVGPWSSATWAEATRGSTPFVASSGTTEGARALQVPVTFRGAGYQQGYCGRFGGRSLAGCGSIAVDVTIPAGAPRGLRAKLVLLAGPGARWTEGKQSFALTPGATTTVRLAFAADAPDSLSSDDLAQASGWGLKVESDGSTWTGAVALDRVRSERLVVPTPAARAVRSVGTFGGFVRGTKTEIPERNGFLTFVADTDVKAHALRWPKLGGTKDKPDDFRVGEMHFPGISLGGAKPTFVDWTTLRASAEALTWRGRVNVTATLSRAFPAVRWETTARELEWRTALDGRAAASKVLCVMNGRPTVWTLDRGGRIPLATMSEPWALVYAGGARGWSFDAPVLLTFQHRPTHADANPDGLSFAFGGAAGAVHAMPLFGLKRLGASETTTWERTLPSNVLLACRAYVSLLLAFPIGCDESYELVNDEVRIVDRFRHAPLTDDWGNQPVLVAPVPPVVFRAGQQGYPVRFERTPEVTEIATFFGPFAFVRGAEAVYRLPVPAGARRLPVALRVENDGTARETHALLAKLIDEKAPRAPMDAFLDNDDRAAAFLAEALPALEEGSNARKVALAMASRLVEGGWRESSLQRLVEPVTGQWYLNNAKYWCSNEPFDKEWYTGRQLAALALVSEACGLEVARATWPKVLGLYRYDQIFFDWATGSVLSSVLGWTALADGIHFAWEGELGVARLARHLGDETTRRDAIYRAARQQAMLFACWHQAAWARDLGYAVGHLSGAPIPASQVETRGAVDGLVEETGCTTLEFRSFWQTTNFVFFDCVPQLSFYRDHGLAPRVERIEREVLPALHPHWADGNVMDPVDKKYYGTEFTAAHLMVRALLLHEDPARLLRIYKDNDGTEGSKQWYTMHRFGIAGPTLLAIERARAPLVEVPTDLAVTSARWDAATGTLEIVARARTDVRDSVVVVPPGGARRELLVSARAGELVRVTERVR